MNISLTCCVSLVGFDWGPNPSLQCMNVGLNIHQMLSQKLYPLLSTTHKGTNRDPPPHTNQRSPAQELNLMQPWVYSLFARVISAARRSCLRVTFCHADVWIRMGGGGSAQVNPLHNPPAVLLLPAGSFAAFQPSEDRILCRSLAPSVAVAAYADLARKSTGTFLMHGSSYMF